MSRNGKHKEYNCELCSNRSYRSDKLCCHLKILKTKQQGPFSRVHAAQMQQPQLIRSDEEICEVLQDHLQYLEELPLKHGMNQIFSFNANIGGILKRARVVNLKLEADQELYLELMIAKQSVTILKLWSVDVPSEQVVRSMKKLSKLCFQKNISVRLLHEKYLSTQQNEVLEVIKQWRVKESISKQGP